jgi:hypothetical protein
MHGRLNTLKKFKNYFLANENISNSDNNRSGDITYKPSLINTSKYYKDVILSNHYHLLFLWARLSYKT